MEERTTTAKALKYINDYDSNLTGVMPAYWQGHGRVLIAQSELSQSEKSKALSVLSQISENHPSKSAESIARLVISKLEERR